MHDVYYSESYLQKKKKNNNPLNQTKGLNGKSVFFFIHTGFENVV